MEKQLEQYRQAMQSELDNILSWWMKHAVDEDHGGFVGKIDHNNKVHAEAPKGVVLNSRILWTFSAAYHLTAKQEHLSIAELACKYLLDHFVDKEYGGVYWTVSPEGKPLDTNKKIYALAFAVYALSEYYKVSKDNDAKQNATSIYHAIVEHSYDKVNGGYLESLSREWADLSDLRLSDKDANEKKSMNTHLHVLEAFANLYSIWPDPALKQRLKEVINIFQDHIISKQTHHLILFFDERWNTKSPLVSYGHDIEAAWLVQEAAEILGDEQLSSEVKTNSLRLADAASEGLDSDGGMWYEYDPKHNHWTRQKTWWPQAEAMVGFLNAWQLTGKEEYLQWSLDSWDFIKKYLIDKERGEWYWGVEENYALMVTEDKAGLWKCPYHNSRACMEVIKRIR